MSYMVFNKCCFCIDLRLGSFIIAYFTLVFRISSLILASVRLSNYNMMLLHHEELVTGDLAFHKLIGILSIMILVFEILICVALLVGLHKRLDQHLEMFYVGSFGFLVMGIFVYAIVIFRYSAILKTMAWVLVGIEIVAKMIFIYFLAVIRSYYYKMKDETDREELTKTNQSYFARTKPMLYSNKP